MTSPLPAHPSRNCVDGAHLCGSIDAISGDLPPEAYGTALAGLPGMGPARLAAVLEALPAAAAWARARRGEPWRESAVVAALGSRGADVADGWRTAAAATEVTEIWARVLDAGVGVAMHGRLGYPPALESDIEPPAVLFHLGTPDVIAGPRVAIIGTRRCTSVGRGVAFELGRELARAGVAVVSGLAAGIDGAAHRGALSAAATPPIGVVGSGLDVVYPPKQEHLWHEVAQRGVLLSETPLGGRPERWRFPARNRIIAALADLVIVVESHRKGGSLHTVDEADRRGVDVMAVPGSVRSAASVGTNDLLAEGRAPLREADDALMALGLEAASQREVADRRVQPSADDGGVLEAVGWQPSSLDQIALRAPLSVPQLASALDRLIATGWVEQDGGWYARVAFNDRTAS